MTELETLQAKHREEAARKRAKLKERKARAHRLIERGAPKGTDNFQVLF